MRIDQLISTICCICILYFIYRFWDRYTLRKQVITHKASITRLEKKIKKKPIDYYKLGQLYHHGTADAYKDGRLVNGIKPDPIKAITNYNKAIENGDMTCIFDLAQIYHWGMNGHNVQDINMARRLYTNLINEGSLIQQTKAKSLLNRLENETIQQQEYHKPIHIEQPKIPVQQLEVPVQTEVLINESITTIQPNQYIGDPLPTIPITFTVRPQPRIPFHVRPITDDVLDDLMMFFTVDRFVDNTLIVDGPTVNDSQNVHDTGVNSTIAQSVKNLKQDTILTLSIPQCVQDITNFISEQSFSEKNTNAMNTLNFIQDTNAHIVSCNMSELELLQLIWNRIISSNDSHILKDSLVTQLAECVEYGEIVCTTGRYTRIIDCLNLVDPLVSIKPQWVISNEILQRAGVLFNDFLQTLTEEQKNIYDNDLDGVNDITQNAKMHIRSGLQKEYVDTNIIRQDIFEAELAKWLDSIC